MQKSSSTALSLALRQAVLAFFFTRSANAGSPKLLVFVQTVIKQRALQLLLQDALPGLEVTAVGRVADFERGLEEGQDAVLTLPAVMQTHGIAPQVRGRKAGAVDEPYSLVAVDATPSIASLKTVGAIEMLDRAGTNALVRDVVGKQVKVERVAKVEDLLPLLQLSRADAVLLPSRMIADIKKTSSLNLASLELPKQLGLPALAAIGGAGKLAVLQAGKLSGRPAELLGVDSWQ
jgi:hypothetical protein